MDRAVEPLGYVLKRTQASLRQAMDEALRAHGLSMAQFALLSNLDGGAALTNAELARRTFVTPQTTIRILSHLERAGLVRRTIDAQNRRRINTSLTPTGTKRLRAAEQTVRHVEARMVEGLDEAETVQLRSLLERAATNLASTDREEPRHTT